MMTRKNLLYLFPFLICFLFFAAYSTLSIIRHNHYQSFGYDLGINDQTVWRYSQFQAPLTTIDPYPDKIKLYEHVEIVYALISPAYWIWDSRKMLLILEAAFVCSGGVAIYFLARERKLTNPVSTAILISYLGFFGVQNAIWFDVHSISFGAAFIAWFLYFLDGKKLWPTIIFFILAVTAKENVGLITFFVALVYFVKRRDKLTFFLMFASFIYVAFIFLVYFPYIIHFPYPYQNKGGILSNLNPLSLFDTTEKLQTLFYTGFTFGFIPLLNLFATLPILADIGTYFVLASDLPGAQGIYAHYRITLAPLLSWSTITVISRFKFLNSKYVAAYLITAALIVQYALHLPLSYLAKSWFWQEPPAVKNINTMIRDWLPKSASVVAQNNIVPHISHRDKIYSLYPEVRTFTKNSPCGKKDCNWFRWFGSPQFLFVDTSADWDARHLLTDRPIFIDGLKNLETEGVIKNYKQIGNTILYKVRENPDSIE